jgi:hypothetical protein
MAYVFTSIDGARHHSDVQIRFFTERHAEYTDPRHWRVIRLESESAGIKHDEFTAVMDDFGNLVEVSQ